MTDILELVAVEDLREGDLIDLENDPFADPFGHVGFTGEDDDHDYESDHMALQDEYAVVDGIEQETANCTVVYTDTINVGFPHGYKVKRWTGNTEQPSPAAIMREGEAKGYPW